MKALMIYRTLFFATLLALPGSALAQSNLQGAGGGLQPQTSQTQNTRSLQNQTAPLQTNNPGTVLSNNQPGSLGVVSSPNQTRPDVVATADPNLKTDITRTDGSSAISVFLAIVLVIVATGVTYWVYGKYYRLSPASITAKEPVVEEIPKAKKTKKKKPALKDGKPAGKKRKSKRRY